jgi:hypothetical protein
MDDHDATFLGMYRRFGVVPQGILLSLPFFSFLVFLEPYLGDFLVVDLRPLLCGFGWGCMHETFMVLFLVIPS